MFKTYLPSLALVAAASVSQLAAADPFSMTWTDTLGPSDLPYITGESISVTVVVDNGGTDAISQTWSSTDLVSVTYEINNSPITTEFGGGGLALTTGSFTTDAGGALTAVPSAWGNFAAAVPVTSSDDPEGTTDVRWVLNGINYVYRNDSSGNLATARAVNPASNITVAGWSNPIAIAPPTPAPMPPTPTPVAPRAVPTMSAYGLILTALGLLVVARRRLSQDRRS